MAYRARAPLGVHCHEDEAPGRGDRASGRLPVLGFEDHLDGHRRAADGHDLGNRFEKDADGNRGPEVDGVDVGGDHRPASVADGGNGRGLVHEPHGLSAEESAVLVGVGRLDEAAETRGRSGSGQGLQGHGTTLTHSPASRQVLTRLDRACLRSTPAPTIRVAGILDFESPRPDQLPPSAWPPAAVRIVESGRGGADRDYRPAIWTAIGDSPSRDDRKASPSRSLGLASSTRVFDKNGAGRAETSAELCIDGVRTVCHRLLGSLGRIVGSHLWRSWPPICSSQGTHSRRRSKSPVCPGYSSRPDRLYPSGPNVQRCYLNERGRLTALV